MEIRTKPLGEKVRALRKERGLTQEGLAEQAGVTMQTVWNIEDGRIESPALKTLRGLASAFGVSIADLIE